MCAIKRFMVTLLFVLLCALVTQAQTMKDQSFFAPETWANDLAYKQGWGAENPRLLADVNGDGKQDIVGFGQDGVWIAFSTGAGFGPIQFALAEFGYNQGWRVSDHVRAAADINGDGMQDLAAFDYDKIVVARSSDLPPPSPPETPTDPRITSKTTTSLTFAWDDNSNDETGFLISWREAGGDVIDYKVNANTTSHTFVLLEPGTQYCFSVRAFNFFGESGETRSVCARTNSREEPPPPTTAPSIVVSFEAYFPQNSSGQNKLRIKGGGFQPSEQVLLVIVTTLQGQNPFTQTFLKTADSLGTIDFEYTGASAAGACFPGQPRSFEVQAIGQATSKKSNVVTLGC